MKLIIIAVVIAIIFLAIFWLKKRAQKPDVRDGRYGGGAGRPDEEDPKKR